jgi:hypothetical protein
LSSQHSLRSRSQLGGFLGDSVLSDRRDCKGSEVRTRQVSDRNSLTNSRRGAGVASSRTALTSLAAPVHTSRMRTHPACGFYRHPKCRLQNVSVQIPQFQPKSGTTACSTRTDVIKIGAEKRVAREDQVAAFCDIRSQQCQNWSEKLEARCSLPTMLTGCWSGRGSVRKVDLLNRLRTERQRVKLLVKQ